MKFIEYATQDGWHLFAVSVLIICFLGGISEIILALKGVK